ncbi:MAG: response regulator [Acidobacteriota bacterium]
MNYDERLRVLYIEDDRDSFEMIKVMLSLSGIAVESAPTAGEAVKRAGSERFDLYLLDSGLPDGSGLGLCRKLRVIDPRIPVLFYSGNAHVDDIERGMAAGAAGYITKPNSDKLAASIVQLVTNYRERRRPAFTDYRVLSAAA